MRAVDQLLEEAKRISDQAKRKELYTEVWNIVNVELPQFHLHEIPITSAAVKDSAGLSARVRWELTPTTAAACARRTSRREGQGSRRRTGMMIRSGHDRGQTDHALSRRTFLTTTSAALARCRHGRARTPE